MNTSTSQKIPILNSEILQTSDLPFPHLKEAQESQYSPDLTLLQTEISQPQQMFSQIHLQQQQTQISQTFPFFDGKNSKPENNLQETTETPKIIQKENLKAPPDFILDDDEDEDDQKIIQTNLMSEEKQKEYMKIKMIITYIVTYLNKDESVLQNKKKIIEEDQQFEEKRDSYVTIFNLLVKKFQKLRKTKEEMTKFCMRKAFRYLFSQLKIRCNSKMNFKEANEICMKHYFKQHVNDSQFILPFRRNSSIKTMNTTFLKKVFSSQKFVQDYCCFLNYFDQLAIEDNQKKIDLLAYYILPLLNDQKFEKIENLRRLPWTFCLLDLTKKLSFQLLELSDQPHQQYLQTQYISFNKNSINDIISSKKVATENINNNPSSNINSCTKLNINNNNAIINNQNILNQSLQTSLQTLSPRISFSSQNKNINVKQGQKQNYMYSNSIQRKIILIIPPKYELLQKKLCLNY